MFAVTCELHLSVNCIMVHLQYEFTGNGIKQHKCGALHRKKQNFQNCLLIKTRKIE